jgi:hypothetical protein
LINQLKEKLDINIDRSDIVAMHRIPGRPAAPRPTGENDTNNIINNLHNYILHVIMLIFILFSH